MSVINNPPPQRNNPETPNPILVTVELLSTIAVSQCKDVVDMFYIFAVTVKLFYSVGNKNCNFDKKCLLSKNLKIKIYRTIILPVVLYGYGTWSLTLREERKLRVFQNMVLRRIFGPRRDEITGVWRRLHNEELNDLYSSPNIVRVIKSRRM